LGSCDNRLLGNTYCQIHSRAAFGYLRPKASGSLKSQAEALVHTVAVFKLDARETRTHLALISN
jgi:hypothetical protein